MNRPRFFFFSSVVPEAVVLIDDELGIGDTGASAGRMCPPPLTGGISSLDREDGGSLDEEDNVDEGAGGLLSDILGRVQFSSFEIFSINVAGVRTSVDPIIITITT